MNQPDRLLYPLFDYLRRHGVPLGVSEYQLAVETLREGRLGLHDVAEFKQFCTLLWAKSVEDQVLFEEAFERLIAPQLRHLEQVAIKSQSANRKDDGSESESSHGSETSKPPPVEGDRPIPPPSSPSEKPLLRPLSGPAPQPFHHDDPAPAWRETYHLTPRLYLGSRDVASVWRNLRHLKRIGPPTELDVPATLNHICQTGLLLKPIMRPRRINQMRLIILVDRYGSMEPFQLLLDTLRTGIEQGSLLGRLQRYYFHDCPEKYLYQQPTLTQAVALESVLLEKIKGHRVLIISDAGAARGHYEAARLQRTRTFISQLSQYTYLYCWLNPVPVRRWAGSTAADIAQFVPMYYLDRDGMNDAVNILRGKPFPPEVQL